MSYRISYGGMMLGKEEKRAVKRVLDRNWWPLAEEGKLMEKEAAAFLGMKHGVLANSGSSAGLLALQALELPPGSEVIIPATTFPTIFNIILQLGLMPVVVDTIPPWYNLFPSDVERAIRKGKTKAVICVHAVGNPCDMPKIMRIAKENNLYVIEDNCDGWGGTLDGKRVGSFGDVSFTSFHAAHIVSMGQGGGVFTNDKEIARKVRMYRDWGRQSDLTSRTNTKWKDLPSDYDARFIYEKIGYNLSPLELQAAMGRVQLKKTEKIKRLRQKNFSYLFKHLLDFSDSTIYTNNLVMPEWINSAKPSWFAMPLSVTFDRGSLVEHLEKNGIETRSMFAGNIIRHPAYVNSTYRTVGTLHQADWIMRHSFWIGVHPRMTQSDLEYVVKVFKDYYNAQIN